jgi:hypothetical protein
MTPTAKCREDGGVSIMPPKQETFSQWDVSIPPIAIPENNIALFIKQLHPSHSLA